MPRRFLLSFLYSVAPPPDHISDASLIRRYVQDRDQAAFELLVRRHADAVWAACIGILRNEADAEDAFQATFLALAKQAKVIHAEPTAAGWLYRVAVNAALKRKQSWPQLIERRSIRDSELKTDTREELETQSVIHQELATLREHDRLPLVICDLEGHTREEAAGILGWPLGTVNGRLSRARELLKSKLLRRGIVGPATLAAISTPTTLSARAAILAVDSTTIPESISTLATGALSAMTATKFKLTAALAAGVMLATGAGTMVAMGQFGNNSNGSRNEANTSRDDQPVIKKRAATKLVDGRIVLFPEIEKQSKDGEKVLGPLLNEISKQKTVSLEDGIQRIKLEKFKDAIITLQLNQFVLDSGNWDVQFMNQLLLNLDQLKIAGRQLQISKRDYVKILKTRLLMTFYLEYIVKQRVEIAGSLRKQQYHEVLVQRYQCELDLAEAEDAVEK